MCLWGNHVFATGMHGTYVRHDRFHESRCFVVATGDGVNIVGHTDGESWTGCFESLCKHLTDCRKDIAGTLVVGIAVSHYCYVLTMNNRQIIDDYGWGVGRKELTSYDTYKQLRRVVGDIVCAICSG